MAADRGALRRRSEQSSEQSSAPSSKIPTGLGAVQGKPAEPGPLDLDRLIHERVRLGIVSALAVNGSLTFTDLRDLLGTTDGNLSAHARRLEEAGYIVCKKSFEGRTPKTEYTLTAMGKRELNAYLDHMEAIIDATRE